MKEQYDDLSAASERIKLEISQLEVSRNNAQKQYNNTLATNGQIKMEIAKRDNAQNTYNSMVNHNTATNNQISNMALERDNLQNNYINPYINALQEARNALGILAFETVKTMKMVDLFDFRTVEERKYADKYYHIVEKKHKVKGLFGITIDPKYTYHREFNQAAYNNDVIAINSRISNAENQLNIQKANYQGKINTLNIEISNKQSSLYSPLQIQQGLQTLDKVKQAVSSIGITLETSEQQVTSFLQILNNTSSTLKSKQADLEHNEQKKGQVAERIKAEQLRIQKLEAERLQAEKLKLEKLEAERIKAEQLRIQKLEAERLQAEKLKLEKLEAERIKAEQLRIQKLEAERLQAEKLKLEKLEAERIKAEQLRIQELEAERLQAEKLEFERLEAEKIKAEQIKAQKLELESLAKIEGVETTENILGLNENQVYEAEVNINLSGDVI